MNYETALKLKEHGFPQEDRHWYWCSFTFPNTLWCINALEAKGLDKEYECMTAAPTLEELIEACGEDFCGLIKRTDWLAVGKPKLIHLTGSTALEAVANLYCALHGDKNPTTK